MYVHVYYLTDPQRHHLMSSSQYVRPQHDIDQSMSSTLAPSIHQPESAFEGKQSLEDNVVHSNVSTMARGKLMCEL